MVISMICFAAQKTFEIVCAFQIGYRLNAWVYIHLSHSGCEVVVKAKDLCYIQRKVDINDAGFKFNNIWRHTKTFEDLICSSSLAGGLQQQSIYFTAVHILLSPMAFLGNFLILAALHKVSSLHRPSKLLYPCLATTDLLVSIVRQPFIATYWMSLAHEELYLCRFAYKATYITAYALCSVSLLTMAAISVSRLLALSSGLRYRQIVTLKRTYCMVATFWDFFWCRWSMLHFRLPNYTILPNNLSGLVNKDFLRTQSSPGSSTRFYTTTAEPNKCTKHHDSAIKKGSV